MKNAFLGALLCLAVLQGGLTGCSLSPFIERSSVEYNAMVANYADQVLLETILRAKDNLPISMTSLTSITGSFSFSGSITGSRTTSGSSANTWSPTLTGVSSPNWSMTPLSTQGFALSIMQPVSPTYVLSKWDSGMDKEFLLLLFVKSITIRQLEYRNNPDSDVDMKAFRDAIEGLNIRTLKMKAMTVLEPVGPDFDPVFGFPGAFSGAQCTPDHAKEGKDASGTITYPAPTALPLQLVTVLNNVAGSSDAQYHYGNDKIDATSACVGSRTVTLQLYREYPNQVTLCTDNHPVPPDELKDLANAKGWPSNTCSTAWICLPRTKQKWDPAAARGVSRRRLPRPAASRDKERKGLAVALGNR